MRLLALTLALLLALPAHPRVRAARVTPPPADAVQWLRQYAIPLANDFSSLGYVIGDAQVVALGDATHGTHELFAMKVGMIEWLVEQAGFRTIAFEAPYAEFEVIREYVLTGRGDPAEALRSGDYFFWDTDEILGMIEWARAKNAAGITLEIVGIDSVHPHPAMERVLAAVDPALRDTVAERYSCLASYASNPWFYGSQSSDSRRYCRDQIAAVRPLLPADLQHAARVVEQGEATLSLGYPQREAFMAENLEWLRAQRPEARIVWWGHNEHVRKTPHHVYSAAGTKSAGAYLAESLGHDYRVIGSTIASGTFWAMEITADGGSIQMQTIPPFDDFATLLRSANLGTMLVPLAGAPFAGSQTMRIAGANVVSRAKPMVTFTIDVKASYDAMVFVETSTPSRMRHFPRL